MWIINLSKNTILADDIFFAKTVVEKDRGLFGSHSARPLFLETRWGIHTFDLKFSIDRLVCDDKFTVRALRQNIAPGNFFFWQPTYKNVLELPAGVITETRTQIGDALKLEGY